MIRLLKVRKQKEFNDLYDKYAPALYGVIIQFTPEPKTAANILQKSFLHIWRNLVFFDASKGSLVNWMVKITLQQCREILGLPKAAILQSFKPRAKLLALQTGCTR